MKLYEQIVVLALDHNEFYLVTEIANVSKENLIYWKKL